MKVRLAVCVIALSTTAGIATACPDDGKAGALLAKASADDELKRATVIGEQMGTCMQKAMGAGATP